MLANYCRVFAVDLFHGLYFKRETLLSFQDAYVSCSNLFNEMNPHQEHSVFAYCLLLLSSDILISHLLSILLRKLNFNLLLGLLIRIYTIHQPCTTCQTFLISFFFRTTSSRLFGVIIILHFFSYILYSILCTSQNPLFSTFLTFFMIHRSAPNNLFHLYIFSLQYTVYNAMFYML